MSEPDGAADAPQGEAAPSESAAAPVFRISMNNATLMSVLYFGFGGLVEALRRLFHYGWTERVLVHLDRFPAGVLELLGLLRLVREGYLHDTLSPYTVRLVFGVTTVVVFYATAAFVGALMWGLIKLAERQGVTLK